MTTSVVIFLIVVIIMIIAYTKHVQKLMDQVNNIPCPPHRWSQVKDKELQARGIIFRCDNCEKIYPDPLANS